MNRVVITGMGAITPLGNDVASFWDGLKNGKNGIDFITKFDTKDIDVHVAAEVKGFDPTLYMDRKEAKRMDLFCQYGIAAALQAVEHSGITQENTDFDRFGVIVSSGIGGLSVSTSLEFPVIHSKSACSAVRARSRSVLGIMNPPSLSWSSVSCNIV